MTVEPLSGSGKGLSEKQFWRTTLRESEVVIGTESRLAKVGEGNKVSLIYISGICCTTSY